MALKTPLHTERVRGLLGDMRDMVEHGVARGRESGGRSTSHELGLSPSQM